MPDMSFRFLFYVLQSRSKSDENFDFEKTKEEWWLVQSHCYLNRDLSHSFPYSLRAFPASRNTTVRSTSRFHHNNINNLLPASLPFCALCSFRCFGFFFVYFKELQILLELMEIKQLYLSFIPPLIH